MIVFIAKNKKNTIVQYLQHFAGISFDINQLLHMLYHFRGNENIK
jgi:hypothetical protein